MNNSKQKRHLLLLARSSVAFFIWCFSTLFVSAQISHSFSQIPVGNSDINGFVRIDKVFYNLELGNGRDAKLFFKLSSDPRWEPKYMGAYWTIPFFDSKAVKISANRYTWESPNSEAYTFNKSPKPDKGYKETYILNITGKWKLNVAKDESISIENVNDERNRFLLKNGRLTSFCAGKDADIFRIAYGNKGVPQSIYNISKNSMEVELIYNRDGFLSKIVLQKDKKALFITYGQCDTFTEDGITKQGKLLKSVSSITFADNSKEEYKYSTHANRKIRNILTKKGEQTSVKVSVNRFEQKIRENNNGFIEWDATTGIIISDSGGGYAVRNPMFDKLSSEYADTPFATDRKRQVKTKESRISYKKPENKYAEIWDYNLRNAVKVMQNPNTGEQTKISYIGNSGSASMKVRKIEMRKDSTSPWNLQFLKLYNDRGHVIRILNGSDSVDTFEYAGGDIPVKAFRNGVLLWEQSIVNGVVSEKHEYASSGIIVSKYNSDGRLESIRQNDDFLLKREYDVSGRLLKEDMPGIKIDEFLYSQSGEISKKTKLYDGTNYTSKYDKNGTIISTVTNDGEETPHVNKITPLRTYSERDSKISEILVRFASERTTPSEQAQLLLDIGRMYFGGGKWKDDPESAIKIYERIIHEFPYEYPAVVQAYSNLTCIYMERKGLNDRKIALDYMNKLYAVDISKIPNEHRYFVRNEQNGAFNVFLSLHETGNGDTDIRIIKDLGARYAHSNEQKNVLKYRLSYLDELKRENLTK